jgi:hypothetical protein
VQLAEFLCKVAPVWNVLMATCASSKMSVVAAAVASSASQSELAGNGLGLQQRWGAADKRDVQREPGNSLDLAGWPVATPCVWEAEPPRRTLPGRPVGACSGRSDS